MTNSSPPESPNPMPERRRRPATGVTFDEMIAIIVAFATIGTILFWAIGGKNNKLAGNFGLNGKNGLLASDQTTDTGRGFGSILSKDSSAKTNLTVKELEAENRRLAAQLRQQDAPVIYIPPNKTVKLPAEVEKKSIFLDSGAKLVPLAGVATLPALRNRPGNLTQNEAQPEVITSEVKPTPTPAPTPAPIVTQPNEPVQKPTAQKPTAVAPATKIPQDVTPEDWSYPFIKQMSDKGLVSALTGDKNFEPNKLITRASMATLISRAFDMQPETQKIKKFQDVSNGNEIASDIDKAVRLGFMQGYSENTFRPLENIPRYQVLVTLATGLGLKPSGDTDQILQKLKGGEEIPNWAKEQVAAAYESNLIVNRPGFAKDSLMPNESATRGEVAAMIHQALVKKGRLKPLESEYILKP